MVLTTNFLPATLLVSFVFLTGCEGKQSKQMRDELSTFGEQYLRLAKERNGDVDWNVIKEHQNEFPGLAKQIADRTLLVTWFADFVTVPNQNNRRILAYDCFAEVRGGMVLFQDGSVRNISASELEKLRNDSEKLNEVDPVEIIHVSDRTYVETSIPGLTIPLPNGWQWDPVANAYRQPNHEGLIHLQLIQADMESAEMAVAISLKRSGAGGIRKSHLSNENGIFWECYLQSGENNTIRERMLTLLLSYGNRTAQITASLPTTSQQLGLVRETLLGTKSKFSRLP